ncbi:MAG: fluoride efflux transporter CrcB [Candidatus Omnitrophica bacterium]|jgi:CrcB protein|nr:fluoride efflux transporter CrcB [Candidatus Omnitrophota bacterium]MDD5080906.1 fluoride efflux transporter CrcB [Candidatus Omnitrophota bacterium]
MISAKQILSLVIGGALGTVFRYLIYIVTYSKTHAGYSWGTFSVNCIGCFVMGFAYAFFSGKISMDESLRLMIVVGFCGAFTTFSSFVFENFCFIRDGQILLSFINIIGGVILGLACLWLGMVLGELV